MGIRNRTTFFVSRFFPPFPPLKPGCIVWSGVSYSPKNTVPPIPPKVLQPRSTTDWLNYAILQSLALGTMELEFLGNRCCDLELLQCKLDWPLRCVCANSCSPIKTAKGNGCGTVTAPATVQKCWNAVAHLLLPSRQIVIPPRNAGWLRADGSLGRTESPTSQWW